VDFRTAISEATFLLDQYHEQPQSLSEAQLRPFLATEESSRGFFVAYLTGEWTTADNPPQALVELLREGRETPNSVLIRNLVMSSATEAAHQRTGDETKAAMSHRVSQRTAELITRVDTDELWDALSDMRRALLDQPSGFTEFLARVGYSDDEKLAATQAVDHLLTKRAHTDDASLDCSEPI
jgi:hypothetical protein